MMVERLSDLSREEVSKVIAEVGQPAFRAKQLWHWMSKLGIFDLSQMGNLPQKLRDDLQERFPASPIGFAPSTDSSDETCKLLFELGKGEFVESVLIPAPDRTTICLSSQVGCAVGCHFCASGIEGGKRNLSRGELFEQYMAMKRLAEDRGRKVSNLVVMGMGEPMFNYNNLMAALDRINSEDGPNLGARRITISTIGIAAGVAKFTKEKRQYALAFSLHAPNDTLRQSIVPLAQAMKVEEIRNAAERHLNETGREVTLEYVLLKDINDGIKEAEQLKNLLRHSQVSVNLIPYNPVPDLPYERPSDKAIDDFASILELAGIHVSVRRKKGSDINAACGQLALKKGRSARENP